MNEDHETLASPPTPQASAAQAAAEEAQRLAEQAQVSAIAAQSAASTAQKAATTAQVAVDSFAEEAHAADLRLAQASMKVREVDEKLIEHAKK